MNFSDTLFKILPMKEIVLDTDLKSLKLFKKGKVRDIYELDDKLLIVATDRISAFDVVLPCGIPQKGRVLTALSLFWFDFCQDIITNHLIPLRLTPLPEQERKLLEGRAMLVKKVNPIPVECIVRGYLSGSAWKEYQSDGSVSGIKLPPDLQQAEKLEMPIFTPSTKAKTGHDVNITFDQLQNLVGTELALKLRQVSIKIYLKASPYAEERGIIIADTKFEFGIYQEEVILIDELLTPDSSRFWAKEEYEPGKPQPSFDKQLIRDYLEGLNWDKKPPAPELPPEVIEETSRKYLAVYRRLMT
ncbi:phosphoribosylaminoimidazolesuccinocarboxamide synthase [Dehalococcoidales bacterium]|nr:phosphoribosylaminoimidazolesuccinocarboxamide synthase [Dehalococcoidales bacterium]